MYLRHSSVVLERVFLSMLPLLNCPKSGKRIFKSVSVVVQYFSVLHSQVALNLKQLSVWPISEAFLLPIVQKKTILILPLLSDKDAKMKAQIFVLREDTAVILGNTIKDGNDKILNFNHGNLII